MQIKPEKLCMACGEAVTNPICPDCLARELEYWLNDRSRQLLPELRKQTKEFKLMAYGRTHTCVLCNTKMNFCSYCYIEYVYDWLKTKLPRSTEEFTHNFGYIKHQED